MKFAAIALPTLGLLTLFLAPTHGAQDMIGVFETTGDVGSPKIAGSTTFDPQTRAYTMTGAGANMWLARDEHQFAWKRISGDFIVTARGQFTSAGGRPHRKFGWIVRASLDPQSAQVNLVEHGDGRTSLQWRPTAGAETKEIIMSTKGADVLQLQRKGDTYVASYARFGDPLQSDKVEIDLGENPYVGLFVCSHNADEAHTAVFRDVRITIPVRDNFVPYKDYIGSNIEILDVATGDREIVYHTPENLEAPNWSPDGKSLYCNGRGRLFRFDVAARTLTPIDTGSATRLNNDHVIAHDGRRIAISHNAADAKNKSVISMIPVEGGDAKRVTPVGHSYLHGWSPDDKYLVFTGQREGSAYNIYRIPADGGDEQRLSSSKLYDDGPEYTPDGKYIYFNSTRTGRMQIWRMKPDGADEEQVTDDEFNNWFAHPSPDGKSFVIISYLADIKADDHPYYKQVYLRLMPADGGKPRVIAYVYGGQGTINVPSWSPDSKKIAFVSNTAGD